LKDIEEGVISVTTVSSSVSTIYNQPLADTSPEATEAVIVLVSKAAIEETVSALIAKTVSPVGIVIFKSESWKASVAPLLVPSLISAKSYVVPLVSSYNSILSNTSTTLRPPPITILTPNFCISKLLQALLTTLILPKIISFLSSLTIVTVGSISIRVISPACTVRLHKFVAASTLVIVTEAPKPY
jgi:hypothetical protein